MSDKKRRVPEVATELNVAAERIIDFLEKKNIDVSKGINTKIDADAYALLLNEFAKDKQIKTQSQQIIDKTKEQIKTEQPKTGEPEKKPFKFTKKTDSISIRIENPIVEEPSEENNEEEKENKVKIGPKIVGKIELPEFSSKDRKKDKNQTKIIQKNTSSKSISNNTDNTDSNTDPQQNNNYISHISDFTSVEHSETTNKIDTKDTQNNKDKDEKITEHQPDNIIRAKDRTPKLSGLNIKGKIDLPLLDKNKPKKEKEKDKDKDKKEKTNTTTTNTNNANESANTIKTDIKTTDKKTPIGIKKVQEKVDTPPTEKKRKRKRKKDKSNPVDKALVQQALQQNKQKKTKFVETFTEKDVDNKIKQTLSNLNTKKDNKIKDRADYRKQKRLSSAAQREAEKQERLKEAKKLQITEGLTTSDLAGLMDVPVRDIIQYCFNLGMIVTINQRLDQDTIAFLADEYGFEVEFVDPTIEINEVLETDNPEDLVPRPPIVTIMGHVDHGKTSLLDYIRSTNVVAGEAGGITQHIGAYEVTLPDGRKITFLDTPGHEAFTAMRARGAQITDIVVIVVAADDHVMPQTKEAINHAQAAGVPIIVAINKIDKPTADPDRIRKELAEYNILVEDWGGKYQCQEISAKFGKNVDLLLEKILLEAEILDLKANPNRLANGVVIESKMDKEKGVLATVMVQNGTLKVGDDIVVGIHYAKVRALLDERGNRVQKAGPSTPVQVLGIPHAPQAGDSFVALDDKRTAKELAEKRARLHKDIMQRIDKRLKLEEFSKQKDAKELRLIIKGDVNGSVEALSDALLKLSTNEVIIKIIHKGVGQISETDVNLAAASNAIILGFQVRPSAPARKLAENNDVEIRHYSIIYDAIEEVKQAMEGMLSPEIQENITCMIEVREVFHISKVGTVAGCYVQEGKVTRNTYLRVIREGIVIHEGEIASLKRFKDDVKEVGAGYECGIMIKEFEDIKVGDTIEGYEKIEVKRTLNKAQKEEKNTYTY
ncbi:MAG: translation initiation factor IF-2 [Bacteroidia bacterium]|nr:translation initiation factor IF-2 [Bacteroidia bacterium]MDW8346854.1 translation initiation factor IF-2 [Bacteroidia bacterium]